MKKDFKKGDIIEWDEHRYKVIENHGTFGTVENSSGEIVKDFSWKFLDKESVLISRKEIEVTQCGDCPLFYIGSALSICNIDKGSFIDNGKSIPKWCPLRSGPIIVRLKDDK